METTKLIQPYLDNLKLANKSKNTIRVYVRDVVKFLEYFNIDNLNNVGLVKQSDYVSFVSSLNISPNSINATIRNLSVFHSWLLENGYTEENIFAKVKFGKSRFVKVDKKVKPTLTDDEIVMIIKAEKNIQYKFMFSLMVMTAIRRDEVSKIKLSDIEGNAIIINGKGSKQRRVFMNDFLFSLFQKYLKKRKTDCEYLFYHGENKIDGISVNNRIHGMMRENGIEKNITAHRLRATALSNIIRQFGILQAMKVAGHSSINTTKIYDCTGEEVVETTLMSLKVKGLE